MNAVVTIPAPLARYFSQVSAGVRVVQLPFEPPRIAIKLFQGPRMGTTRGTHQR